MRGARLLAELRALCFLAWRNVHLNYRRSLLSISAIALGVTCLALVGGFVEDMYRQLAERTIHSQLGHLQVSREGFRETGAGRSEAFLIERPGEVQKRWAGDPDVAESMGRIGFPGLLGTDRRELAVEVEAVEPAPEARLGTELVTLAGRPLQARDHAAVMLGEGVAKQLGVRPGAWLNVTTATLDGAMNSYELEVTGVFRSFSKEFDERTVRVPLSLAQDLLQTTGVNTLVLRLKRTEATDAVLGRLADGLRAAGLEIMPWHALSEFYISVREMYSAQFGILKLIALVLMAMSVVNSLNMTVFERTAEFGTMRALGNRNGFVFRLIVVESLMVGLLAVLLAMVLAVALAAIVSWVGIPMPPPPNSEAGFTGRVALTPAILLEAGAVGLLSALLASLIPAWRAASMPVVEGLRQAV